MYPAGFHSSRVPFAELAHPDAAHSVQNSRLSPLAGRTKDSHYVNDDPDFERVVRNVY